MFGPIFWKIEHGDRLILFHFLNACAINNRFWQKKKKLAHSVRPKTVPSHLKRKVEGRGKGNGERKKGSEAFAETEKNCKCPSRELNLVPSANAADALPMATSPASCSNFFFFRQISKASSRQMAFLFNGEAETMEREGEKEEARSRSRDGLCQCQRLHLRPPWSPQSWPTSDLPVHTDHSRYFPVLNKI